MTFDVRASREYLAVRFAAKREQAEARRFAALDAIRHAILRAGPLFTSVKRIFLFGSILSAGQFRPDSDIDVGVEGDLGADEFFGLWRALEQEAPGWQVDLVELDRARVHFADRVRLEGELIYEARNTDA